MKRKINLLSIIIVVKNDRGVGATLDHIHKQQSSMPFETIVVDASRPEVLADIREAHPWVRWYQFPVSSLRTTPQQRNAGLAAAKGSVIVFIDANCIPVPGWIASITQSLQNGENIICGPVEDLGERNLVHYAPVLDEGRYIDVCATINVAVRREVFETIGGFDPTFSFGQDVDFFWRAADAGYRIYYNPDVAIGHDWGQPKEQFGRAYNYGKARAHLYKKHWLRRYKQLIREPHVWAYPLFMLGLPLTIIFPFYPLLLLVPAVKNYSKNPVGTIMHHTVYGAGVITGALKPWPRPNQAAAKLRAKRIAA